MSTANVPKGPRTVAGEKPKQIQATELRIHTREILEDVRWRGGVYRITTFGKSVAVIVPVEMFEKLDAVTRDAPQSAPRVGKRPK